MGGIDQLLGQSEWIDRHQGSEAGFLATTTSDVSHAMNY